VRILFENVNPSSTSGPNYFGSKLIKYLESYNCKIDVQDIGKHDVHVAFIESTTRNSKPLIQRLDGIYFNANFNCDRMNSNIRRTYERSSGVIFQTEFNRDLCFSWFGKHNNYTIIRNGADRHHISTVTDQWQELDKYENVWACASNWHVFKRLDDNIRYFKEHASSKDCLVIAGSNINTLEADPRIIFVGNLDIDRLISLYKKAKYFIHLAYLDHCPNVVVDASACGCIVICSSSGGTQEVAGDSAIVIEEPQWDFSFIKEMIPPPLDFSRKRKIKNIADIDYDNCMQKTAKKYYKFIKKVIK